MMKWCSVRALLCWSLKQPSSYILDFRKYLIFFCVHIRIALYMNGDIVEGTFMTNLIHGPRINVRHANGDVYEGGYLNNKRHGKGKLYIAKTNERFEGEFCNGYMHGKGVYNCFNGDIYQGKLYTYHKYISCIHTYIHTYPLVHRITMDVSFIHV